jgi:hypothetical protein
MVKGIYAFRGIPAIEKYIRLPSFTYKTDSQEKIPDD